MSVFLLQNNQHVHQILDDRESALRYTAHSHQDDVEPQMKLYDKVDVHHDRNIKGGFHKELMIRKYLEVTFYPPALHELIDDLYTLFELHYLPLSVTSYDNIHCLWKARNARRFQQMKCRNGLVRIFRK